MNQWKIKQKKKRIISSYVITYISLGARLLGNLSTGKGTTRPGDGTIRARKKTIGAGRDFSYHLILQQIFEYNNIIKMNINLMVIIQEIIYLK